MHSPENRDPFAAIIAQVIARHAPVLNDNAARFLRRVYEAGLAAYSTRLTAYGFTGQERVLDAGCGFGQWTLALSRINKAVYAVDTSAERIRFVQDVSQALGIPNISASVGRIDTLHYPDKTFDVVFCYGVIFLTPWKETVKELGRVMKRGGRLYVNANGFGWYKHLWYHEPNQAQDYDPKLHAAKVLRNTWQYGHGYAPEPGIDILIEPAELESALREAGFVDIRRAAEGCLRDEGYQDHMIPPFFKGEYMGDLGVYEVLARKGRK